MNRRPRSRLLLVRGRRTAAAEFASQIGAGAGEREAGSDDDEPAVVSGPRAVEEVDTGRTADCDPTRVCERVEKARDGTSLRDHRHAEGAETAWQRASSRDRGIADPAEIPVPAHGDSRRHDKCNCGGERPYLHEQTVARLSPGNSAEARRLGQRSRMSLELRSRSPDGDFRAEPLLLNLAHVTRPTREQDACHRGHRASRGPASWHRHCSAAAGHCRHQIRTRLHKKDYGGGMKFVDVDQTAVAMTHEKMQRHAHVR
jgi:hypothetical protein